MAEREDYLRYICIEKFGEDTHSAPSLMSFDDDLNKEVKRVYTNLGGCMSEIPFRFKKYDIDLKDFIIELDEQEHFNRFRLMTLESPVYKHCQNFDVAKYREFCEKYECNCRTYGKYWENDSTKKQFSPSEINGQQGASRWKQRAFYDFIKDVYSVITAIPIIRISIYERCGGTTIDDLIRDCKKDILLDYINQRYLKVKG